MEPIAENIIVIHDAEPKYFAIWLFMMCIIAIAYFVVSTMHDMNREARLEELREEIEREKERRQIDRI